MLSWTVRYESLDAAIRSHELDYGDLVYLHSDSNHIRFRVDMELIRGVPSPERATLQMELAKKKHVYLANVTALGDPAKAAGSVALLREVLQGLRRLP